MSWAPAKFRVPSYELLEWAYNPHKYDKTKSPRAMHGSSKRICYPCESIMLQPQEPISVISTSTGSTRGRFHKTPPSLSTHKKCHAKEEICFKILANLLREAIKGSLHLLSNPLCLKYHWIDIDFILQCCVHASTNFSTTTMSTYPICKYSGYTRSNIISYNLSLGSRYSWRSKC